MSYSVNPRVQQALFVGILLVYGALGLLFAVRTPAWQAPDEPAHYNYAAQVAAGTLLPVIQDGDWNQEYLEALKAARFHPDLLDEIDSIRYENHQPPLYYWFGGALLALTSGELLVLRLLSVALGAGIVALAYAVGRVVFPQRPLLALAAMALVAFTPMHLGILGSANNDALANLLVAGLLLHSLRRLRGQAVPAWQTGLLAGLAFITKSTAYFMIGLALLALLYAGWRAGQTRAQQIRALGIFGLVAAPFALFWWGRNIAVYGFPDFLGLRAHDAVVIGQLRSSELIEQIGGAAYLERALRTVFQSFWGQFGWMGVPMPDVIYGVIVLGVLLALSGFVLALVWRQERPQLLGTGAVWALLGGALLLALAMLVYYNTEFVQFQGRYLFGVLIPFALVLVAGLDEWRARLLPRAVWLPLLPGLLLAALDVYLIWRVLPGALAY